MKNSNLISIITPAYNAAPYINETIQSVISQTYQNWELLIADDCSPDETREVVKRWCDLDGRINLICQNKNGGPAAARNAALEKAKGRWVAFLDSDDIWMPRKLELQLKFHTKKKAKISYTECRRISEDGNKVGHLIKVPSKLNYFQLLKNTAIVTSTVLIDREKTGQFIMRNTYYDDFVCWLELLKSGGQAVGLHQDLLRYRVVGGSVSRNKSRSAKEVWNTYRKVECLNLIFSTWCFFNYAIRGWLKYRRF